MSILMDLWRRAWAFGLGLAHRIGHLASTSWAFAARIAHHIAEMNRQEQLRTQQHNTVLEQAAWAAGNDALTIHGQARRDAMAMHQQAHSNAVALHHQAHDTAFRAHNHDGFGHGSTGSISGV